MPMTAAIMRTESALQPDPEAKSTRIVGKEIEFTEKDLSSLDHRDVSIDGGSMKPTYDHTHRRLKPRHLQLIGIGGTIGTVLYVQIGSGLRASGPGSLFLGFSIWLVVFFLLFSLNRVVSTLCLYIRHCMDGRYLQPISTDIDRQKEKSLHSTTSKTRDVEDCH